MSKKRKPYTQIYERLGTISVEDFLSKVPTNKDSKLPSKIDIFDKQVSVASSRYKVYKLKGIECVQCKIKGQYFALEKSKAQNTDKFHFNLYGIDKYGTERMMTIDHIIPKAKGGNNSINNKQPMCSVCNNKKADKLPK